VSVIGLVTFGPCGALGAGSNPLKPLRCSCTLEQCSHVKAVVSPEAAILPRDEFNFAAEKFAHDGAGLRCRARIAIESLCDLLAVVFSGFGKQ
jgi:hypothetical protein